ncbi:flavoprotein-like protein [Gilbertella persicaria]|uniref:flavoprotein-like protein n=1 Tax=Gilbertella persicaria TaxID=101096 RepID=UPI00221F7933|nr:flavoprotein-like protein [Gilbertella persicaria]KAI8063675.1 flavoprotein-like protein [Gilbertella persicaria]
MNKPVVYIVIYSLYQHVYKLALSVKHGLEEQGVNAQIFQVAETLTDEVLAKMEAPPKPDIPIMTVEKLSEPDGILFGLPTRFGTMPAQMKTLLDASGALWAKGALAGKFAGTFFCTASQHGGQETTALTAVTYFAHHGMLFVPFGYAHPSIIDKNDDQVVGGSAYGAGTVSDGDGSRQPSLVELDIAKQQGANFGTVVGCFVRGRYKSDNVNQKVAAVGETSSNDATGNTPTTEASGTSTSDAGATNAPAEQGERISGATRVGDSNAGKVAGAGVAGAGVGAASALAASRSKSDTSADKTTDIDRTTGVTNTHNTNVPNAPANTSMIKSTSDKNAIDGPNTSSASVPPNTTTVNTDTDLATPETANKTNTPTTTGASTHVGNNQKSTSGLGLTATGPTDSSGIANQDKTKQSSADSVVKAAAAASDGKDPTKVGAEAGANAASSANALPNTKKPKQSKLKKYFCCGF